MEYSEYTISNRPGRPLGVWLLTVYAAIFAGLIPLTTAVVLTASGGLGYNSLAFVPALIINSSMIYFSWRTWRGDRSAIKYLLILITIHYILIGINNGIAFFDGLGSTSERFRLVGRMIRAVLVPVVYIWYFRRWNVQEFFQPRPQPAIPAEEA